MLTRSWRQRNLASLLYSLSHRRLLSQKIPDPKHVFTDPSNNEIVDSKHFFTNPSRDNLIEEEAIAKSIEASIKNQRRRRGKQVSSALAAALFATIFGYTIGYKVLYLHEHSFIPAYPVPKARNFSSNELKHINVDEIKHLAEYKLLEKLSMHPMIKEQYGVPLHKSQGISLESRQFSVWRQDVDPCIAGILIAPIDSPKDEHTWHNVPPLCKWRITNRSVNFRSFADQVLGRVGIDSSDLIQVIKPEKDCGDFKYGRPPHHSDGPRTMHICFLGEMKLGNEDLIIFRGTCHIDLKLQQVDLLRKENDKLVRYVLYHETKE
ncbi:Aim39p [Lachancea thermotolerans CBS 6340]|uniref:Altered inheritance of mitochondria protein 39, mitochondrial n=1 Tax=Lachancea thermotolerans (strain ATCC 56472 / CBS 6340 / NRRL Y-8284) TaxID=559295 RepID=AIM39_LACTC|nr:KLTH0C04708p [Lachancea thermotolerans CBS 6340]C5DDY0.1 RecName: Full=Altered inheritance of mitochondria protein 39, mitochondrial; Flags: Precursor [Lachancea thermotolerans CBS 6340]CAR21991.1 KLTH0C04708p [Lachancea thermotolerans CBS 6340]